MLRRGIEKAGDLAAARKMLSLCPRYDDADRASASSAHRVREPGSHDLPVPHPPKPSENPGLHWRHWEGMGIRYTRLDDDRQP